MSDSLQSYGVQLARLPCSSSCSRIYSNSRPLSQWCHPTISFSIAPFSSCPQSYSASGSVPKNQLFTSGSQSIEVQLQHHSFQWIFRVNPLGLTGFISLKSKGLSRVFSNTTVQRHQFSTLRLFYGPTLTSICDYWKNHSFDYTDFCLQSDVSAF